MDKQRAKEITDSPSLINVTYNGDPVYIQRVDEQNGMAHIYSLQNPDNQQQVSVNDLQEQ